jgi:signal transduction histidine kinase
MAASVSQERAQARVKDQVLAVVAHELRTPLAAMLTSLEVLRRSGCPNATAEQARGRVERQARHMSRLIEELLDVSRMDRGKIELSRTRVDLVPIVIDAIESVRPLLQERHHEVEVTLPPQSLWLDGDRLRLEQIILNLLTNASRYTEPGGRIWLEVERRHGEAVLRLRDTGVGIAADLLPSIFDLFVQARNGCQGGLGIDLVRGLVQLHGGSITASSPGPGEGSEFLVRLPLREETDEQQPPVTVASGLLT